MSFEVKIFFWRTHVYIDDICYDLPNGSPVMRVYVKSRGRYKYKGEVSIRELPEMIRLCYGL